MAASWPSDGYLDCVPLPAVQHSAVFTQTDAGYGAACRLPRLSYDDCTRPQWDSNGYVRPRRASVDQQRSLSCHSYDRPALRLNQNRFYADPSAPVLRSGRLGGQWRHIRQVTGNLGNHICFVDGTVKLKDMMLYPPFGYNNASAMCTRVPQSARVPSARRTYFADNVYQNKYNEHARMGKKYWYEDKLPMALAAKQTIGSRLMKLGIGH